MAQPWSPEIVVSVDLAKKLIEEQFPELAPVNPILIGQGFDNSIYRVNDQYAFRFPRRTIAVELLKTESRLLPTLVSQLPLPIPEPEFFGVPNDDYPWPFTGARLIHGVTPGRLTREQRLRMVEPLAKFLRTLHDFPVERARELGVPGDWLGRMDLVKRRPMLESHAEKLIQNEYVDDGQAVQRFLSCYPDGQLDQTTALVHGDLHFRNLIVDEDGELAGVIDWGDTHVGHPAVDLAILYGLVPPEGHQQFFAIYGDVDEETKRRARFWAIYVLSTLILYGHDHSNTELVDAARENLRLALLEG